eukprot:Ihof_evm1s277 gene=Ihof_evmTU1s277
MSWFGGNLTDLVKQAESLLDTLDQTAANALGGEDGHQQDPPPATTASTALKSPLSSPSSFNMSYLTGFVTGTAPTASNPSSPSSTRASPSGNTLTKNKSHSIFEQVNASTTAKLPAFSSIPPISRRGKGGRVPRESHGTTKTKEKEVKGEAKQNINISLLGKGLKSSKDRSPTLKSRKHTVPAKTSFESDEKNVNLPPRTPTTARSVKLSPVSPRRGKRNQLPVQSSSPPPTITVTTSGGPPGEEITDGWETVSPDVSSRPSPSVKPKEDSHEKGKQSGVATTMATTEKDEGRVDTKHLGYGDDKEDIEVSRVTDVKLESIIPEDVKERVRMALDSEVHENENDSWEGAVLVDEGEPSTVLSKPITSLKDAGKFEDNELSVVSTSNIDEGLAIEKKLSDSPVHVDFSLLLESPRDTHTENDNDTSWTDGNMDLSELESVKSDEALEATLSVQGTNEHEVTRHDDRDMEEEREDNEDHEGGLDHEKDTPNSEGMGQEGEGWGEGNEEIEEDVEEVEEVRGEEEEGGLEYHDHDQYLADAALAAQTAAAATVREMEEELEMMQQQLHEGNEREEALLVELHKLQARVRDFERQESEMVRRWAEYEKKHHEVKSDLKAKGLECQGMLEKEAEIMQAIRSKDSQIVSLTAGQQRLQEELKMHAEEMNQLNTENDRLRQQMVQQNEQHQARLEDMERKRKDIDHLLELERQNNSSAQSQQGEKQVQLENDLKEMTKTLVASQHLSEDLRHKLRIYESRVKSFEGERNSVVQEFTEYKQRATRILQTKEQLIGELKMPGPGGITGASDHSEAEFLELKHDRDRLNEELQEARMQVQGLRADIKMLEDHSSQDIDALQEQISEMESEASEWKAQWEDRDRSHKQQLEVLRCECEEGARIRDALQQRIQSRDEDIEKYRMQLTTRTNGSEKELENRLHQLTNKLIQQQSLVESLTSSVASLELQLETEKDKFTREVKIRIHQDNVEAAARRNDQGRLQTITGPASARETPVTRHVRQAANVLDSFSVKLGIFLRRHPMFRIALLVYV